MAKQGFRVLDSDMHIMEPPDLWVRYIDEEFKALWKNMKAAFDYKTPEAS